MNGLAKKAYELYYASGSSWALALYFKFMQTPWIARALFQMKVLSPKELSNYFKEMPIYFGLDTLLLKIVIEDKLRQAPNLKLLEIGVGSFAILSGYLSRLTTQTVDAIDINRNRLECSKKHVELNQVNVRLLWSDLFSNLIGCKYDQMFWNIPGSEEANLIEIYNNLFKTAPDYMNENGQILLSYNNRDLKRNDIRKTLKKYERLYEYKVKTWWWNAHDVFIIAKK